MKFLNSELRLTREACISFYQTLTNLGQNPKQAFENIKSMCEKAGYQARYKTYKSFRKNIVNKVA